MQVIEKSEYKEIVLDV